MEVHAKSMLITDSASHEANSALVSCCYFAMLVSGLAAVDGTSVATYPKASSFTHLGVPRFGHVSLFNIILSPCDTVTQTLPFGINRLPGISDGFPSRFRQLFGDK